MEITYRNPQWQPIFSLSLDANKARRTLSKQNLKRKASGGDQPTKYLVSEAVGGLGYESRAKLGCQLSSLNRMVQRSRKAANRHPSNPRDLETLSIPANYILSTDNEPMMLWDSGWDERTRRSFLWGTPKNDNYSNPMDFLKAIGNLTML